MRRRVFLVLQHDGLRWCRAAWLWMVAAVAQAADPEGNSVIRAKAGGSEIVLTTTERLAGAIHSLTWNGQEFVDSADHGRQIQSAANFDQGREFFPELFNPTEAGSMSDGAGPRSSSRLLAIQAKGSELTTRCQMAFWLAPGEKSAGRLAYNDRRLSDHLLAKRVKIGHGELSQAISYDVVFTVPKAEPHRYAQFEAVTGYMPPAFSRFWTFDPATGKVARLDDGPGEQSLPVILATENGSHAMGVYSPDQPSKGFEAAGYGRFRFEAERVNKWNCVFRVRNADAVPAGDYRFRCFLAVGTLEDTQKTLAALVKDVGKKP